MHSKHQRNRMSNLINSVREYGENDNMSAKEVDSLVLQLISNDEKVYTASNICKVIVETGTFGSTKHGLNTLAAHFFLITYLWVRELCKISTLHQVRN